MPARYATWTRPRKTVAATPPPIIAAAMLSRKADMTQTIASSANAPFQPLGSSTGSRSGIPGLLEVLGEQAEAHQQPEQVHQQHPLVRHVTAEAELRREEDLEQHRGRGAADRDLQRVQVLEGDPDQVAPNSRYSAGTLPIIGDPPDESAIAPSSSIRTRAMPPTTANEAGLVGVESSWAPDIGEVGLPAIVSDGGGGSPGRTRAREAVGGIFGAGSTAPGGPVPRNSSLGRGNSHSNSAGAPGAGNGVWLSGDGRRARSGTAWARACR